MNLDELNKFKGYWVVRDIMEILKYNNKTLKDGTELVTVEDKGYICCYSEEQRKIIDPYLIKCHNILKLKKSKLGEVNMVKCH